MAKHVSIVIESEKPGDGRRRLGTLLAALFVLGLPVVAVGQTPTATTLGSSANPSVYGQSVTFTATVSPVPDGGTVTFFRDGGAAISGPIPVNTANGQAQVWITTLSIGTHPITAVFSGTTNYGPSTSAALSQVVNKRSTTTLVMGSDTPLVVGDTVTVTVRVVDTSPGEGSMPTGNVTVSVNPTGQGTPTSWSHTLVTADAGQFTFSYTPTSAATTPHMFTGTYAGDSTHNGSSGTFAQALIKRAVDVHVVCNPTTAYIGQPVTVVVVVEDDTTAGGPSVPTGTITFDDGGKNGVFSSNTATLTGGSCTVTYTPGAWDAGTTAIGATYSGSNVHSTTARGTNLGVLLRPTETTIQGPGQTLLVNQSATYTVTVTDTAGVGTAPAPTGTLAYSSYLGADASITPTDTPAPSGSFSYRCLGLDGHAGIDTLYANYTANDGIHASSKGYYGQGIQRRPTITTLSNCISTPTGVTCTATVAEDPANAGPQASIQGNLVRLDTGALLCAGLSGPSPFCTFSMTSTLPLVNVAVRYVPTDRVHLESTASKNVNRYDQFPPDPGDGSTGGNCTDGCGSGGVNVAQMIFDLNAAEIALKAVKWGLDITALVLDVIPDGVIVGGLVVSTGVTIPYSDIAKAIVAGAGIALDIAIEAMDTDLDDDGIPDVLENSVTGTDYRKWDTDGDGLGDLDEIEAAGGYYGGSRRPNPNVADSDGDGLSDGDEDGLYHTNFCVADTDCDGVGDGVEVATWANADARNHSDPLAQDTDGDGLPDALEIALGCPFVNDADSDDDGLQDGYEDRNRDGIITHTIGNGTTQGSGETCFCTWDTDGDGLSDGEEEGMFGASVTPRGVSAAVGVQGSNLGATVPGLDTDMDNDGLSDYAELNTYQTDPTDADTDNDTLSDGAEVATWANADARNHANPLAQDTDGDGLTDNLEITFGCTFVNDADSDDDGLQDGYEDYNRNGTWNYTSIGNSTSQGSGETNPCNPDTDVDGLLDGVEEGLFGAGPIPVVTATGVVTTVAALDDDSDNDGLSDWEEVNATGTNPLHWDTDGDGLSDADELIATGGTWPKRTFVQESDPLDPDTDDDGLPDAIEYPGTGLGITRGLGGNHDTLCPFVTDDDSDDDGLQDGYEDKNRDGIWNNYQIGNSTTQGWGETCACNADSDGDGLQDGEEEGFLGRMATPQRVSVVLPMGTSAPPPSYSVLAGSLRGTGNDLLAPYLFDPTSGPDLPPTAPALDTDSDNDGLSDFEEVHITGTDPLDADSDNDTLADADELIAGGGAWPKRQFEQVSNPLSTNADGDHLFDPQEFGGTGLRALAGGLGGIQDLACPYVNDADSDDDGIQDGAVVSRTLVAAGVTYAWTHYEDFADIATAAVAWPGTIRVVVTDASGEQQDDNLCNVCDPDSDGDGLLDGEEAAIGTDPGNWDTDGDGRNDWQEVTGGGPIPTDPFDPDTDDDGLLDSVEVFGSNPTNPVNCDTDGDGLCDGGARTPYMTSGHPSVVFNPRIYTGIGGHSNPLGIGEDEDGNGTWNANETNPNNPDTDGDAVGDGIERLSFSVSRQHLIPKTDLLGRPITVVYPEANNVKPVRGCMDPLNPDSDGDGLLDGEEDRNHDGNFDFRVSDFDYGHHGPIPGPAYDSPLETSPCDPDTDHDGLTDWEEMRGQTNPPRFFPFNPTNPLDHDTDNDWLLDGEEVRWTCTELTVMGLDSDGDGLTDEDPADGLDNDGDGLVDEDDVDFYVRYVPVLDPTDRDSDSDGFIDGLDSDPCNTQPIPLVVPVVKTPVDTDGDGFADEDEVASGTDPHDPESHPHAFVSDLDLDGAEDDRIWLTDATGDGGVANTVTIDIDSNVLVDLRVQIVTPRDIQHGDFDGDGAADDRRYVVTYAFANRRVLQPRITLVIYDFNGDLGIDRVEATR